MFRETTRPYVLWILKSKGRKLTLWVRFIRSLRLLLLLNFRLSGRLLLGWWAYTTGYYFLPSSPSFGIRITIAFRLGRLAVSLDGAATFSRNLSTAILYRLAFLVLMPTRIIPVIPKS